MEINSNPTIVKKVDIPASLLAIQVGETVRYRARSFAPYGSVRSAVSRLNQEHIEPAFLVCTDDNGATFLVTRQK